MESKHFVFQCDSEIIRKVYTEQDNFLIEYDNRSTIENQNFCIIYFSSNDIYYPNTKEEFTKQILERNKFEWYRTRIEKGEKHIFMRDIQKQWYLTGINHKLNSIEKVLDFLKKESEGYNVVTLGSSAGGFAAVLFGQMLNAELIFSFNGQMEIKSLLKRSSEAINPILFREQDNITISQYFELAKFISNPSSIYYFYSNKSKWDKGQFDYIKKVELNYITFNTNHHGIPFLKSSLPYILSMNKECLTQFSRKTFSPIGFSIKIEGVFHALKGFMVQLVKYILKKYL